MGRSRALDFLALALLVIPAACAPPAPRGEGTSAGREEAPAQRADAPKILRLAVQREPNSFLPRLTGGGTTAGGATQMTEIAHNYLALTDARSTYQPALAEELPSIERGTWKVHPDGTMDTIWKLRRQVQWHDGTAFTSDDLVFSWEVASDPSMPTARTLTVQSIASVVASDPHTVVVRWKRPFADADGLDRGTLDPLPRWILGEAFKRGDVEAFLAHPSLTTEWVGLGPFRLVTWALGSHVEFARFDQYYRGRPPLDGVVLRFISDPNAMIASILAEELDVVLPIAVGVEGARTVEERWAGTRNQVLVAQNGRLRFASPQYRVDAQAQPALLESAVRRAMYHAVDRQALVDAVILGYGAVADSFIPPDEAMRAEVESAIPQHPYDLRRAARDLADLGWMKGGDGVLRHREGKPFEFTMQQTASGRSEVEQNVAVDGWRQLGMRIEQRILPAGLQGDEETRAKFPGVEITAVPYTSFFEARLHSKYAPMPETRWRGSNRGSYANPQVDALMDRLVMTIPKPERLEIIRVLVREVMGDVAIFPLYWDPDPILALARVKNVPMPSARTQVHTWNIYQWDIL